MSDWVDVGSPPDETSTPLMARMLSKAGVPTDERQDAGFDTTDPLSPISGIAIVPEPAPTGARRSPGGMIGLGAW